MEYVELLVREEVEDAAELVAFTQIIVSVETDFTSLVGDGILMTRY